MDFEKFKELLKKNIDVEHPSEIAREFNVSPQVVNNWKKRNHVPKKYVKMFKSALEESKKSSQSDDNELLSVLNKLAVKEYDEPEKPLKEDLKAISVHVINLIKNNFKTIIAFTLLAPMITAIKVLYFSPEVFHSDISIIPLGGDSKSSIGGVASQFGINLNQGSNGLDVGSVNLIPDLVSSRAFHYSLLDRTFETKNAKKITLLEHLYGKNEDFDYNKKYYQQLGSSYLKNSVSISKKKRNDIIHIRVSSGEAKLSADLASAIVEEIDNLQKKIVLNTVKDKLFFIKDRMSNVNEELIKLEEKLKNFRTSNRNINKSPTLLLEENRLVREVSSVSSIYTTLRSQYELAKIEEIGTAKKILVIDKPEIPIFRTSPQRTRSVIQATIFGFLFSIGFIYFRDFYEEIKNYAFEQ